MSPSTIVATPRPQPKSSRRWKRLGRRARAYQASVDDFEQDREMVGQIEADLGPVGILVNNAGIASRGQAVVDTDPAEMQRVVACHAFAPHYLSKLVIPKMRELDAWRHRNDFERRHSQPRRIRCAVQHGQMLRWRRLAFTLAKEERPHGIRVNIVAPGLVETEMGRRLMKASAGVKDLRELDTVMPFGRVCQPEDVANVVRFFVSERNSYLTGERVYCDGGGQQALRA